MRRGPIPRVKNLQGIGRGRAGPLGQGDFEHFLLDSRRRIPSPRSGTKEKGERPQGGLENRSWSPPENRGSSLFYNAGGFHGFPADPDTIDPALTQTNGLGNLIVGYNEPGDGSGALQGALHTAGARTAFTSLWRVDDAATGRLMELFYQGLWDSGLGKADALWRAKMTLRTEGFPTHDWAGWVLTGDPD